jgi:hypothetical protein
MRFNIFVFCGLIFSVNCLLVEKSFKRFTNSSPIIRARFVNTLDYELSFIKCTTNGNQTEIIRDILLTPDIQNFYLETFQDPWLIDGYCYYNVLNEYESVLNLLFHIDYRLNNEYYGMNDSPYYKVAIGVWDSGYPIFVIY